MHGWLATAAFIISIPGFFFDLGHYTGMCGPPQERGEFSVGVGECWTDFLGRGQITRAPALGAVKNADWTHLERGEDQHSASACWRA